MASRHGLQWVETLWGLEPRWTVEPDVPTMTKLASQRLPASNYTPPSVSPIAQGGFSKLYRVDKDICPAVMRVALPVDPHLKTASEVATMDFVSSASEAPVPRVLAYEITNMNPLGFEWILMELMPGKPLKDKWRTITMKKKVALVKQLALYHSQLYQHTWDRTGNLYHRADGNGLEIGPIVSMFYFLGDRDRGSRHVPRGPFRNTHERLSGRLKLIVEAQEDITKTSDDEDALFDAGFIKENARGLQEILPELFTAEEAETTTLFHDDIYQDNLLVNHKGDLTAFLDWERVSALPLWHACQLPALLLGCARNEKPAREAYSPYDPECDDGDPAQNHGMTSLYWEHLLEYEQTQLRPIFLAEMQRLRPEWIQHYEEGVLKRDFELAVLHCDAELTMGLVGRWLKAYKSGERESFAQALGR